MMCYTRGKKAQRDRFHLAFTQCRQNVTCLFWVFLFLSKQSHVSDSACKRWKTDREEKEK